MSFFSRKIAPKKIFSQSPDKATRPPPIPAGSGSWWWHVQVRTPSSVTRVSKQVINWFGLDRFWKSKCITWSMVWMKASWKLRELWRDMNDMNDMKVLSCIVYVHGMSITYATRPILELGSGTGAAGLAFAATGAKAVQPEFWMANGCQWINGYIIDISAEHGRWNWRKCMEKHPFANCSFRRMFQTQNWDGSGQRTFVVRHETPVFLEMEIALSGWLFGDQSP